MKLRLPLIIFSLCILLPGWSMTTVDYDYDRDFDFSKLSNYSWLEIPADFPTTEIVVQRIKKAVDGQMEAKGLKRVSESQDFLISLQGSRDIIREEVERGTAYRGYGSNSIGYEHRADVYEYEEGTLPLTIINADGNNLIWQSNATVIIKPYLSVETKEKRTQETVIKLLADFPPTRKK